MTVDEMMKIVFECKQKMAQVNRLLQELRDMKLGEPSRDEKTSND